MTKQLQPTATATDQAGADEWTLHCEKTCLGAILLQNALLRDTLSELKVHHFMLQDHREIFRTMLEFAEEGISFEHEMVAAGLLERGRKLKAAHAVSYMEDLTVGVVVDERHLRHLSENIIRAWQNRELRRLGECVEAEASKLGAVPQQICRRIESNLARIDPRPQTSSVIDSGPEAPVLDDEALHGVAGEIVHTLLLQSEVSAPTLLLNLLVAFGNVIDRHAHTTVGQVRHYTNFYYCCVGESAHGRKGTAWHQVLSLFRMMEYAKTWCDEQITAGLSSGEGLISLFVDTANRAADKRVLIVQEEFASVLKVMNREGNTLSPIVRNLYDTGNASTLTKNNPLRVRDAHLSLNCQITPDELRGQLNTTEACNGFGNRFFYGYASRHQYLPEGGFIEEGVLRALARKLEDCVLYGQRAGLMQRDDAAKKLWADKYRELSDRPPGMFGNISARAAAICLRLSMLFALLDQTQIIKVAHLEAAFATWAFGEKTAKYIWGSSLGDPVADAIFTALRQNGSDGLTRTQVSRDVLGGNRSSKEITRALAYLQSKGLAHPETAFDTGGRDAEAWKYGPKFESRQVQ